MHSQIIYLQHVEQSLPAAFLHAVLIHQDAAQVQEAGVWIHLVYTHHLITLGQFKRSYSGPKED